VPEWRVGIRWYFGVRVVCSRQLSWLGTNGRWNMAIAVLEKDMLEEPLTEWQSPFANPVMGVDDEDELEDDEFADEDEFEEGEEFEEEDEDFLEDDDEGVEEEAEGDDEEAEDDEEDDDDL
jgi:hypothetical protein